jgi:hypothetical protein
MGALQWGVVTGYFAPERKAAPMKRNKYLWKSLIVLVLAAMTFVATGCNKESNSEHPTTGEHPTTQEHPASKDHPDHPTK